MKNLTLLNRSISWAAVLVALNCWTLSSAGEKPSADKPARTETQPHGVKYSCGPKSSGAIALTFDDGPHPKLTPRLLEILKKENVRATFFMLGEQVEKFPDVAKMVADAGFEIGNHSYSHADMTKLSIEEIRNEVRKTQDAIEKAIGKKPELFRPPYGNVNAKVYDVLKDEGLEVVTWSIDPRDWDAKKSSSQVIGLVLKEGEPGGIVCIHDIHARTVDAVPEIIGGLKAKGLQFTTAGDLVAKEKEARAQKKSDSGGSSSGGSISPLPVQPTVPLNKSGLKKVDPNQGE